MAPQAPVFWPELLPWLQPSFPLLVLGATGDSNVFPALNEPIIHLWGEKHTDNYKVRGKVKSYPKVTTEAHLLVPFLTVPLRWRVGVQLVGEVKVRTGEGREEQREGQGHTTLGMISELKRAPKWGVA